MNAGSKGSRLEANGSKGLGLKANDQEGSGLKSTVRSVQLVALDVHSKRVTVCHPAGLHGKAAHSVHTVGKQSPGFRAHLICLRALLGVQQQQEGCPVDVGFKARH